MAEGACSSDKDFSLEVFDRGPLKIFGIFSIDPRLVH
jgi:hypothetical protein